MRFLSISGSVSDPSRTSNLLASIREEIGHQIGLPVDTIELCKAGPVLFRALRSNELGLAGREIVAKVEAADVLVVASPVYRASYTGALKHLFDLVDYRVMPGKRVILAATGGTPLHGLMIDHQLRPLFAFFNALVVPTSIYATESDFDGYDLRSHEIHARISRAVAELTAVLPASVHGGGPAPSSRFTALA